MRFERVIARRYRSDEQGRPALVGLTYDETCEFEVLEQTAPLDDDGNPAWAFEGEPRTPSERRWLRLYTRHQLAWDTWRLRSVASPYLIRDASRQRPAT